MNLSANMFVFGDLSVHRKDWLALPGGTDRSQMTLLRWLAFLLGSLTATFTVLLF